MANDHVGIPRFIEEGFANKKKVYKYDLIREKEYAESIDTLGTENNYYDEDVEKELLARRIENRFGLFYNNFCNATNLYEMRSMLNSNIKLVEKFFSFMFLRAKKILEIINKESITSKIFGNLDHSELLRIQTMINVNPLEIIGKEYYFFPLINRSDLLFINNSIGFGIIIDREGQKSIVIPLNNRIAIFISNDSKLNDYNYLYIEPERKEKADTINKSICTMEKEYGNGFIFGYSKELIIRYKDFINKVH